MRTDLKPFKCQETDRSIGGIPTGTLGLSPPPLAPDLGMEGENRKGVSGTVASSFASLELLVELSLPTNSTNKISTLWAQIGSI